MTAIDHYGEAELELERADKARNDRTRDIGEARKNESGHLCRAAIHGLLALVDAIDDGGTTP
jgi:hypothetical protein